MPDVYLFYSIVDSENAGRLRADLVAGGVDVWWDLDILPGQDWEVEIQWALERSKVLVITLSKESLSPSYSYRREVPEVILKHLDRSGEASVIPVRFDPCDPSGIRFGIRSLTEIQHADLFPPERRDAQLLRVITAIRQATGTPDLPKPQPPAELVDEFAKGNVFAYVGAGLSVPMGMPMWKPLTDRLLSWAEGYGLIAEGPLLESLHRTMDEGDSALVADSVVEATRGDQAAERELQEFLRGLYTNPTATPGANHHRLRELGFGAVLTTNFDELLERTFPAQPVFTFRQTEPLLDALSRRRFFILKLYGTFTPPEPVIVSPRQYEDEIVGNLAFAQFMESAFISRTLLFIGASMDGIEAYLRGIRFRGNLSRKHYALVAVTGRAWRAKAESLRRHYQIEVIPYTLNPEHREVDEFLADLLERVLARRRGPEPPAPRRRDPQRLAKVTLTNIGCFDHLDVQLDPHWNILLGDNGVGKSSVLRAVAAALCGRDAQPFADRLLKYGQTSGQIVLMFADGQEHVTELFRTSGEAEVKSPSARLMDTEGWLALGFPALRTVTWRRSRGPQLEEGKKRPNPADLIPLIDGGPDPRTDQLKQWIINVDYRAKKSASDDDRRRYAHLLDEFFRIINHLTGDLRVGFGRIDLERGQVLLTTDEGAVPLEAVSQGTVSLLGWIGVLMQRLYEVYPDVERPHEQFALVLMDEIDAHMHPDWQQRLVPALAELFPNIQFLATTHSPLIVGGMDVKQVVRFERGEDGKVHPIELDPDTTMGRTDQVLTGDLFGLETTLDSATQEAVARYQELLALPSRSAEQDDQLRRLEETLAFRMPPPYESPPQRRALELLQTLLQTHVVTGHTEMQSFQGELLAR
ncbi:MAG: AAA family ATPase, partial [Candidatus Limnocylindrales bacterium]